MVQSGTRLHVRDNSGVNLVRTLGPGRAYRGHTATFGDKVMCSVFRTKNRTLPKGNLVKAMILQTKKPHVRPGGSNILHSMNSGILWDTSKGSPLATRITCPVIHEVRKYDGGSKVLSISQIIV